jgi:hypothetical protein
MMNVTYNVNIHVAAKYETFPLKKSALDLVVFFDFRAK